MSTEEDTFNRLRRVPIEDLEKIIRPSKRHHIHTWLNNCIDNEEYKKMLDNPTRWQKIFRPSPPPYLDTAWHEHSWIIARRIDFSNTGWTWNDYCNEVKKDIIREREIAAKEKAKRHKRALYLATFGIVWIIGVGIAYMLL
jgi:hypothetical protein